MEEIQNYLDAIRKNGDLRRKEARRLTERLGEVFDRVGDALIDAGIWGDHAAYLLEDKERSHEPGRKATFLRPERRTLYLSPAYSAETLKVVAMGVYPFVYEPHYESARESLSKHDRDPAYTISARPLDATVESKIASFDEDGTLKKLISPSVSPVGYTRSEGQEDLFDKIPDEHLSEEGWEPRGWTTAPPHSEGRKLRVRRREREVPFVPRKLAVRVADQLPAVLQHFSDYVESLAVETESARQKTEAVSVSVSSDF